jgi:hypothetical protein
MILLICNCIGSSQANAQDKQLSFQSSNAMFPNNRFNLNYSSNDSRFNDNSTILLVPKHFNNNKPWHYFLWFHGWNNNIYSTLEQFKLSEQLNASGINTILVMLEAAKNAQDSYFGKGEQANYLTDLCKMLTTNSLAKTSLIRITMAI